MKNLMCSLLISSFFSIPFTLRSQDTSQGYDHIYGLDQTLCNGKKYTYVAPPGSNGNQYLLSPFFSVGSVTIRGQCYRDITLNYDIFNQQLLLQYADDIGPVNIIEVSKAWLTAFSMANRNFEFLNLEKEPQFYQVLGEGPVRILYFWRKSINLNDAIGSSNFIFTAALRDCYVLLNGQLKPFNTKRSLINIFDPGHRQEIKSYLRKHNVKVKKASDQAMADLITFIGNLN
jgi:hypothetical protein